jgi:soluble lytic murein transglycosylase-like protein
MVALARQEHGPNISPKGAFGYMQLMPDTAKELGVTPDTPWQKQVDRGLDYYKSILDRNKGNYPAADAGYNAGPNHPGLPKFAQTGDMSGLPAETQKYVRAIGSVDVNVRLHNAPPGTQVSSKASGNVNAPAPLVMTPMLGMGY